MENKKLIEVALPLDKINAESGREKSIRHGHPSTLHLWWARRPLAAARAVIWSSLVDDPSSHPEKFPTEEDQNRERQRLFKILEDLVVWENSNNEELLKAAQDEIKKSTNGTPPSLLDPFSGGGAIPLEAQRLGLHTYAHDLNPVAILINKSMTEIPSRFKNKPPVNPSQQTSLNRLAKWKRSAGLAEDVSYYGEYLKQEAKKLVGHLYPTISVPKQLGGGEATVVAWIWARNVVCPNPACKCRTSLASSFELSKKKGSEAYVIPTCDYDQKTITYNVINGKGNVPDAPKGKGTNFKCLFCGETIPGDYVRDEAKANRLDAELMAIVAEGRRSKIYLSPTKEHELIARSAVPEWKPEQLVTTPCHDVDRLPMYGMPTWGDAFTNRQLVILTTLSDLLPKVRELIQNHAVKAGMPNDHIKLKDGGFGATAYAEAVCVYLAFVIDKMADIGSSIASWINSLGAIRNTFARQAIPMTWDYAEANPFSNSTGCFDNMLTWVIKSIYEFPDCEQLAEVKQFDAQSDCGLRNIMISTDPPYYDNISYADVSDFFYVWMRQSLKEIYPDLFSTMLVPKAEELIATPYRHDGNMEKAKHFFEDGMLAACKQMHLYSREDIPVTIYYAYKQSDTDAETNSTASSGWETMLSAIINAGFAITGTWPMRTERSVRTIAQGTNALASSIVLVCRKRSEDAPQTTRRNLVNILRRELRPALKKLQDSNIAPVDLAQSAIGPGMGVFSRYRRVLEADGSIMTVRSALQLINEEVDLYFNEQVGSMDASSRFCVDLYTQYAYNNIKYGEAEILANAKSTSIPMMASHGVLYAKAGVVHLMERSDLPEKVDHDESNIWMLTQQLTRAMAKGGVEACAQIVYDIFGSNSESAKDLAYRLYTIAERKDWAEEAYAYNALVVAWPDIQSRAAALKAVVPEQLTIF